MADSACGTTSVTGFDGFLGTELIPRPAFRGPRGLALTRSVEGAEARRGLDAVRVIGEMLTPGRWQDEAAADWAIHLSPPPADRRRMLPRRWAKRARIHLSSDANWPQAVSGSTRRLAYRAAPGCHGWAPRVVASRMARQDRQPRSRRDRSLHPDKRSREHIRKARESPTPRVAVAGPGEQSRRRLGVAEVPISRRRPLEHPTTRDRLRFEHPTAGDKVGRVLRAVT
jgi:hypothetical protein